MRRRHSKYHIIIKIIIKKIIINSIILMSCFRSRKEKLQCLRRIFYNAYSHTVGFRMKDNSESSGFGQLLGNFAEKVGILSVQRTSL